MTDPQLAEQMEKLRQEFERVQATQRTAEERFGRLDEFKSAIEQVEGSATAPDKSVTVVSGPGGSVKSVQFTEHARKLSPTQLSQVVTSTIQQAVARSAQAQAQAVSEYMPDSDILERVLQTQEQAFGQPIDREALAEGTAGGSARVPPSEPRAQRPRHRPAGDTWDDEDAFTGIRWEGNR